MTIKRNVAIDLFWKIHPKIYRWSRGRLGGRIMGLPVLLLTTTGRKTGMPRTKALTFLPHRDDLVIIASFLGQPQHPAWWLNLLADPNAIVQIGDQKYAVLAREATGEERDEIWASLVEKTPAYDEYQAQTSRRIPVVVLERQ